MREDEDPNQAERIRKYLLKNKEYSEDKEIQDYISGIQNKVKATKLGSYTVRPLEKRLKSKDKREEFDTENQLINSLLPLVNNKGLSGKDQSKVIEGYYTVKNYIDKQREDTKSTAPIPLDPKKAPGYYYKKVRAQDKDRGDRISEIQLAHNLEKEFETHKDIYTGVGQLWIVKLIYIIYRVGSDGKIVTSRVNAYLTIDGEQYRMIDDVQDKRAFLYNEIRSGFAIALQSLEKLAHYSNLMWTLTDAYDVFIVPRYGIKAIKEVKGELVFGCGLSVDPKVRADQRKYMRKLTKRLHGLYEPDYPACYYYKIIRQEDNDNYCILRCIKAIWKVPRAEKVIKKYKVEYWGRKSKTVEQEVMESNTIENLWKRHMRGGLPNKGITLYRARTFYRKLREVYIDNFFDDDPDKPPNELVVKKIKNSKDLIKNIEINVVYHIYGHAFTFVEDNRWEYKSTLRPYTPSQTLLVAYDIESTCDMNYEDGEFMDKSEQVLSMVSFMFKVEKEEYLDCLPVEDCGKAEENKYVMKTYNSIEKMVYYITKFVSKYNKDLGSNKEIDYESKYEITLKRICFVGFNSSQYDDLYLWRFFRDTDDPDFQIRSHGILPESTGMMDFQILVERDGEPSFIINTLDMRKFTSPMGNLSVQAESFKCPTRCKKEVYKLCYETANILSSSERGEIFEKFQTIRDDNMKPEYCECKRSKVKDKKCRLGSVIIDCESNKFNKRNFFAYYKGDGEDHPMVTKIMREYNEVDVKIVMELYDVIDNIDTFKRYKIPLLSCFSMSHYTKEMWIRHLSKLRYKSYHPDWKWKDRYIVGDEKHNSMMFKQYHKELAYNKKHGGKKGTLFEGIPYKQSFVHKSQARHNRKYFSSKLGGRTQYNPDPSHEKYVDSKKFDDYFKVNGYDSLTAKEFNKMLFEAIPDLVYGNGLKDLDINGMYASVMANNNLFPIGKEYEIIYKGVVTNPEPPKKGTAVYHCLEIKPPDPPLLHPLFGKKIKDIHDKMVKIEYTDEGLYDYALSRPYMDCGLKLGYTFICDSEIRWDYVVPLFHDYINGLHEKRLVAKSEKNDPVSEALKLAMNGLYGKTGQRDVRDSVKYYTIDQLRYVNLYDTIHPNKMKVISYLDVNRKGIVIKYTADTRYKKFNSSPNHLSMFILDKTHVLYHSMLMKIDEGVTSLKDSNFYYSDTDSFIVNMKGADNLAEFIDDKQLGMLKDELDGGIIRKAHFLARKTYGLIYQVKGKKGKPTLGCKFKAKGIPPNMVQMRDYEEPDKFSSEGRNKYGCMKKYGLLTDKPKESCRVYNIKRQVSLSSRHKEKKTSAIGEDEITKAFKERRTLHRQRDDGITALSAMLGGEDTSLYGKLFKKYKLQLLEAVDLGHVNSILRLAHEEKELRDINKGKHESSDEEEMTPFKKKFLAAEKDYGENDREALQILNRLEAHWGLQKTPSNDP